MRSVDFLEVVGTMRLFRFGRRARHPILRKLMLRIILLIIFSCLGSFLGIGLFNKEIVDLIINLLI